MLKKILLNHILIFILGLAIILFFPAIELWGFHFLDLLDDVRINTILANIFAFSIITLILKQFNRFASANALSYIVPTVTIIYLAIFSYFLFTRFGYSRHVLIVGYFCNLFIFLSIYFLYKKYQRLTYGVLPFGDIQNLQHLSNSKNIEFYILQNPSLANIHVNGIIADLHAPELGESWEKFLAECTLKRIPVFHIKQIKESLTGRIQIEHLSENHFGSLLPSLLYMRIKRIIDILIVCCIAPFAIFIMLFTAIAIRLESKGSVLFIQSRVGQGNTDFRIYKFRSMVVSAESGGAQLAQSQDIRITRIGAFIRKTRLDELPQLWNVLKGDMSLIGPRPEQRVFVQQFENNIPFYIYRHVVKPGMTGWAQVMQGYASNEDETTLKIQYDFYYIKYFSFWLDILICLKTIRVIFTGFGAK